MFKRSENGALVRRPGPESNSHTARKKHALIKERARDDELNTLKEQVAALTKMVMESKNAGN